MARKKYSVIVFDLGNVLIPFDYNIMYSRLENVKKGLGEKFMHYYRNNYALHRSFERGEISDEVFIDKMLESCDRSIDGLTFCKYYSEIFTVNENVAALLPELKKKYKLVLLSNTNGIHREYGYKQYDFLKHFDKLVLSHEAKAVKPEPEIYKAVEGFTRASAEEHLFIDDVLEYVEGAKKMGWDAIQFKNFEQLVSELESRDIL